MGVGRRGEVWAVACEESALYVAGKWARVRG